MQNNIVFDINLANICFIIYRELTTTTTAASAASTIATTITTTATKRMNNIHPVRSNSVKECSTCQLRQLSDERNWDRGLCGFGGNCFGTGPSEKAIKDAKSLLRRVQVGDSTFFHDFFM